MADWFETRFREAGQPERPDPAFSARIRSLVVEEWQSSSGRPVDDDDLDDDDDLGDLIMLETEDPTTTGAAPPARRQRPAPRILVAAAAVTIAVLGGALLVDGDDPEVDTATSTPDSGPADGEAAREVPVVDEFLPLEAGRWFVDPDGDPTTPLRVSFEVAASGWDSWLGTVKFGVDGHAALTITTIDNLVREGCTDHLPADPVIGPTVSNLATALARLAPFEVTSPPSDLTLLGYDGMHVQLTVPEIPVVAARGGRNFEGCTGGQLQSWFSPIYEDGRAPYYGYNEEPGRTEDFWILDVDGTRLVLITTSSPATPAQDVAELEDIIDSIRIEP